MTHFFPRCPSLQDRLRAAQPCLWTNPGRSAAVAPQLSAGTAMVGVQDMQAARQRFARFAGLLATLFPELQASGGVIESPWCRHPPWAMPWGWPAGRRPVGQVRPRLPVAGSIKARGGIHEVLEFAEGLALQHGLLTPGATAAPWQKPAARALFARHQVAVGSTGNLGLSIGVAASRLGFRAVVHMSLEAKEWKKKSACAGAAWRWWSTRATTKGGGRRPPRPRPTRSAILGRRALARCCAATAPPPRRCRPSWPRPVCRWMPRTAVCLPALRRGRRTGGHHP